MSSPARVSSLRPGLVVGLAVFAILVAAGLVLYSRKSDAPPETTKPALAVADGYIGSEACSDCHAKKHERWLADWHTRALSKVERNEKGISPVVLGDFGDGTKSTHYRGQSSEAWMHRDGSGYFMRTQDQEGTLRDFPVQWVIGGKRMQDTVTVFPDGRWQVLPVYYHLTGGGAWVDYNESKQGKVDPGHPFFWTNFRRNANHECLDCHTSGLRVAYDRKTHSFATAFTDAGVACESCHGPGARHAASRKPSDIVHPGKLNRSKPDRERALGICGQCHGPRQPLFPILDTAHRYRAGDRYEEMYQPLMVVNGTGRSGDFFPDGRPKSSSFEYQALVQSRCYLRAGVTCLDCHSAPHDDHGENELRPVAAGRSLVDEGCRRCHGALFAPAALKKHTRHESATAQSCVGCHMPKVVSGVLDEFADHAIDIPAPENTSRHGIKSACAVCHQDKSAEALATSLHALWPNAAKRQARRLRLADAIDEETAKDSEAALLGVIADESEAPPLRATCAVLLGQRFAGSVAAVVPLLKHRDPLVRVRAIEAIGYAKARPLGEKIAPLLDDKSIMVRHAAALILAMLGDLRAEGALRKLARDPATSGLMQPHFVLGMMAARQGDLTAAAERLEHAVNLVPYFTDALIPLADVYARKGQLPLSRDRLLEVLRFEPQNRPALERLKHMR